jgi:hypothetical protein
VYHNWLDKWDERRPQRMVLKQALRQTQGLMRSISKLMGVDITVPFSDHVSRRATRNTHP